MAENKKSEGASSPTETPLCVVCGVETPVKSKCGGCRSVNYCGRKHQIQHWKTGGHREVCMGLCKRCLEPMSSNSGVCIVPHPFHLLYESEYIEFDWKMRTSHKTNTCLACKKQFITKDTVGCLTCIEKVGLIVEGPKFCFEGGHTLEPLPASDRRRVGNDATILFTPHQKTKWNPSTYKLGSHIGHSDNLQARIDEALSPEKEANVKFLYLPLAGNGNPASRPSISHRMSNLTTLKIMFVDIQKLHLTAELTPKLVDLEVRDIPEECEFHVVVPTLKTISIHHYSTPPHGTRIINEMLAAATELESFDSYKLWVGGELCFASNSLKLIEIHRSDTMPGISFWAPNLEVLNLTACFALKNIQILKSHELAEKLPEGHKPTKFRVRTAQSNISPSAMASLERSGRCLAVKADAAKGSVLGGMEECWRFMYKYSEEKGDGGFGGMVEGMKAMYGENQPALYEFSLPSKKAKK